MRAGISDLNAMLRGQKIAIVGLGGTGSYILDLIAKTEVSEIHLIDADEFVNHNAFRAPGAASLAQVVRRGKKVDFFAEMYAHFRAGVIPHPVYVETANVPDLLTEMDFIFLAADHTDKVAEVAQWMRETGLSFINVGMGISQTPQGRKQSLADTIAWATCSQGDEPRHARTDQLHHPPRRNSRGCPGRSAAAGTTARCEPHSGAGVGPGRERPSAGDAWPAGCCVARRRGS